MLLQLQWYNVTIRYRPGKETLLADSWHSVLAYSAGMATSKKAYSVNGQGILGLQRPALYR